MAYFSKTTAKITPEDSSQRISSITVRVCVIDCTGSFYITDIMLQDGSLATGWVGHPSEIQWTSDG